MKSRSFRLPDTIYQRDAIVESIESFRDDLDLNVIDGDRCFCVEVVQSKSICVIQEFLNHALRKSIETVVQSIRPEDE